MGMDDNDILSEIVLDLSFQSFSINVQKINITIHSIGMSTKQEVGCRFTSFFIYTKSKERALFFQTVNKNKSSVYIYKENQLSEEFHGSDPNSVWKKIGILKERLGITKNGTAIGQLRINCRSAILQICGFQKFKYPQIRKSQLSVNP